MHEDNCILFFLKSMKSKHVEETMKKGRFCFSHPCTFNKSGGNNPAQFDRWDGHSCHIATHLVFAPIEKEDEHGVIYGKVRHFADEAIVHMQYGEAKHTPICCFRIVEKDEVSFAHEAKALIYSLGKTADRIINEFGHDSYILIQAEPFIERLKKENNFLCGSVIYKDILQPGMFQIEDQYQELAEQLYRKDSRFSWQKEYRIALVPSTGVSPVFVEIGSIEDIAVSGKIEDLRY